MCLPADAVRNRISDVRAVSRADDSYCLIDTVRIIGSCQCFCVLAKVEGYHDRSVEYMMKEQETAPGSILGPCDLFEW
jgi:hypothetical protein